jgi:hypothetical protein
MALGMDGGEHMVVGKLAIKSFRMNSLQIPHMGVV